MASRFFQRILSAAACGLAAAALLACAPAEEESRRLELRPRHGDASAVSRLSPAQRELRGESARADDEATESADTASRSSAYTDH